MVKQESLYEFCCIKGHGCKYDWVMIKESYTGSILLDKTCGDLTQSLPPNVRSISSAVDVIFHTDSSVTKKGFRLEWKKFQGNSSYQMLTLAYIL